MNSLSSQEQILSGGYNATSGDYLLPRMKGLLKQEFREDHQAQIFSVDQKPTFRSAVKQQSSPAQSKSLAPKYAPVRAMLQLQTFWGLTDDEIRAMCGLILENEQSVAQSLAQHLNLPDIKTRLRSLMAIRGRLSALFNGNQAAERQWLRTPWIRLHGQTPLARLAENNISALLALESEVRELVGG